MLVLDDGWFGSRDSDNAGLGDWTVNEKKLKGGLTALSDKIHDLGLQFGLWIKPEMVNENSDLYRMHPDWALSDPGRKPNVARNQLVLDMSGADVREYLFSCISTLLKALRAAPSDCGTGYCEVKDNRKYAVLFAADQYPALRTVRCGLNPNHT